ncbi:hypothetical protein D3C75_543310 [compost metagenome]
MLLLVPSDRCAESLTDKSQRDICSILFKPRRYFQSLDDRINRNSCTVDLHRYLLIAQLNRNNAVCAVTNFCSQRLRNKANRDQHPIILIIRLRIQKLNRLAIDLYRHINLSCRQRRTDCSKQQRRAHQHQSYLFHLLTPLFWWLCTFSLAACFRLKLD